MNKKQAYRIAVIQNRPEFDLHKSIANVMQMINEASSQADLIVLPEMFTTPYEFALMDKASQASGAVLQQLCSIAAASRTFICAGSMPMPNHAEKCLANRSHLIDSSGTVIAAYDKCHLFDVNLPEIRVSESKFFAPGAGADVSETTLGKIGTVICYDIRFPELARKMTLDGMQLLCVPAAFSQTTGQAHWHTVMRARAIENQIYLCAASPALNPESAYPAYGHSMIISPWGDILAEADSAEEIIYADISIDYLKKIRSQLPLLRHRRPELY